VVSAALVVATLCAALMGFAIQRGATCTVAAVDEIVRNRSARRLASLAEAALWVAGGLLVARVAGLVPHLPSGYALSWAVPAGGVLLGLGAYANRACVFGSIARLGSGDWAYVLTPAGFYAGVAAIGPLAMPARLTSPSLLDTAPGWLALVFALFAVMRLFTSLARARISGEGWRRAWHPHEATIVIGITFLIMFIAVGAWAYTDVLADLAAGMVRDLPSRLLLFAALLFGASLGGWVAGRWRLQPPTASACLRCAAGGALMGMGSALIPGGNDGLILVGMPLLYPYAWVGIATMCLAIAAALGIERRVQAR
jgi:toxin CptA